MIEFTTILREDEHAYVVTIPLQAVIDFSRRHAFRCARRRCADGISLSARSDARTQQYYIEHYPEETSAAIKKQGFEPKF